MKKITALLVACFMVVALAVAVSAYWEPEEAFLEVKFTIGKQTTAWNADGQISDGEYYKVDIDPTWLSYAINDSDTDAGLEYAKATHPELYMSWDENYIYTATRYEVTKGHENLWDGDPASMWYSGAVQFNYANFDEVASEYRLEYGVGLSSETGDILYTVWADGAGTGFEPNADNAKVWLDGNTLTYETKVAWEDFADEDNTAGKEGLGFNFCLVWSIGEGQDYVHIQLAEGCTGNGKHAENFAQVTLGPAPAASASSAAAGESAFEEIWVTAEQEFYDDPETLELGGHGQPIQYVDGYGVGYSSLNDQVIFRDIDFGANGADKMLINFSNGGEKDTTLAIYIDEKSGDPDATYTIPNTGGWEAVWAEDFEAPIDVKSGVHDVIIEFTNDNSGSFYYIKFFEKAAGGAAAPAADAPAASGEVKIEKPEELEYPTFNPLENSGEGFPTNSDPSKTEPESPEVEAAALKAAAESIGKNALTGVYSFVDASAGYNEQEGGASLWDGAVRTKWAGNEMPFVNIAQLDGKYKFDGIIMATANDTASYDRNPMEWAVYGSNDGQTWDPICYGDDSFFELTNLTYYAGSFDPTEQGYELVCFYSDIGGVSGFQISELVMTGEKVGDATLNVNKDEANKWADLIEFTPGDPIANNGASYEDEAAAVASIGGTSINGNIVNYSVGDDKGKTPGFAGEEAEKLWDSDNTTKYCSTYVPETSIIEMDDTYGLNGIVMSTANDNSSNPGRNPSNWAILGSNDLENWTVLVNGNDTFFEDVDYTYYAASFDMTGGYKYFAFENMSTQSGTFQLAEVVLCGAKAEAAVAEAPALPGFETADEAVASIGKTAIAGYTFVEGTNGNGGEGPENLWDGQTSTKFCTGEFPISSTAELDGWYTIDGIVMATANDNAEYNGRLPSAWTVSGSADGENWTVIASGDESFFAEANFRYFAGDASSDAIKFVKFDAEGASSGCFQISELVLTGAKAEAPATYPASGAEGTLINGTVIGNAEGWGGNAAAGAAAAFDGNVATFFDPLGVGDGFCGIDAGEAYILDKVVIMSRADWNARFKGAMIQGSNDGENWTTLWTSEGEGTNPDWYTVTEFENNTGYSQFRYFNTTEHGDVAEVEFYGTVAGTADAALDNKAEAPNTFDFGVVAAIAAVISLGGFAVSKKRH